jgi:hypothetical protein
LTLGYTQTQINAALPVTPDALAMFTNANSGFTPIGNQLVAVFVDVIGGQDLLVYLQIPAGFSSGYWKTHPEEWPVSSIIIGGITYNQDAATEILKSANSKDATLQLAAQLIAAKLNVEYGKTPPVAVASAMAAADTFLVTYPPGSNPTGADRAYALELKNTIVTFNTHI